MADVSSTLAAWSSTTASNNPSGSTTIGTGLDDNLREIQGVIVRGLSHKGSDIASATTTDLGAVEGLMHDITGTTTITSFGTVRAGIWKVIKFEGVLTLTHNATSLILPGAANITTADGDIGVFGSEGSGNWRCWGYLKAAGGHLGPVLATEQATTSGTSIDFTGIPPWAKTIVVQLVGVSTNGTSNLLLQLGDSGGVEATGYTADSCDTGGGPTNVAYTTGFGINAASADNTVHGTFTLSLQNAASFRWMCTAMFCFGNVDRVVLTAGSKALSAALDRVRLTTVNGTDAFDAGAVNILYE